MTEAHVAHLAALESRIAEMIESADWRSYVRVRSMFRTYSVHNQFLIAIQAPDATRVAGFKAWQKLGRQVRAGSKGIRILAPCPYKRTNDAGEIEREGVYFKSVSVFDVAQTDGDPLPDLPESIHVDGASAGRWIQPLTAVGADLGYRVEYKDTGHSGGYCHYSEKLIAVNAFGTDNTTVRTLVHELIHALGVTYKDNGRATAELITDAAATLVCNTLGLDTIEQTASYLAGWANGDVATIRGNFEAAEKIARDLEKRLGV